jgi:hypothetical protein
MSDEVYRQVDEALRTYPLQPAPATLAPRVMARLRALTPAPRFRLSWIDYALSLFAASMLGLALLGWQALTPQLLLRLQVQTLLIARHVGILGGAALVGGLALAGGACLLAALILARPSPFQIGEGRF